MGYLLAKLHKDIIDDIACKLSNLKSLTISTGEPLIADDANALVELLRLKCVTFRRRIYMGSVVKPVEECLADILTRLKHCA